MRARTVNENYTGVSNEYTLEDWKNYLSSLGYEPIKAYKIPSGAFRARIDGKTNPTHFSKTFYESVVLYPEDFYKMENIKKTNESYLDSNINVNGDRYEKYKPETGEWEIGRVEVKQTKEGEPYLAYIPEKKWHEDDGFPVTSPPNI